MNEIRSIFNDKEKNKETKKESLFCDILSLLCERNEQRLGSVQGLQYHPRNVSPVSCVHYH